MLLNKFLSYLYETPADGGTGDLSVQDMVDELSKDDAPIPEVKDDDLLNEPKEKEKPEDKDEELEIEPDEPVIDELEAVSDFRRKDFLKKYPEAFKEFPELERSFYRARAYEELLPTLDDAKDAVDKAKNYEQFESSLLDGNLDTVLSSVKQSDGKAFNTMVENFLPMLGKVDQGAYYHVIGGVIKNTIAAMVREGRSTNNDDLQAAGVILNQFIFGKSEFEAPKPFGPMKEDKPDEVTTERTQFMQERLESSIDSLAEVTNNVVKSTISKHMDPKGVMTDYVRNTAIKAAIAEVDELIAKDPRFTALKNKLWEKHVKDKFSKSTADDIKKAYLNTAKVLLPRIITKHKNEALKGTGKRSGEREEPTRKGPIPMGRSTAANNSSNKESKVPAGMKTLDYLNSD